MTPKLATIVRTLFPAASPISDYRIHDDGAGSYIAYWNEARLGPRPTQEEIDAVDVTKIEHNYGIDRNIVALEAKETPRRIAESITSDVGMKWLVENRQKIAALRSQRK